MWTKPLILRIGRADGAERAVAMRYNSSHQAGTRLYLGTVADDPAAIDEHTPATFAAHRLFDAIACYRATIEGDGWRLLHAIARRDVWVRPDEMFAFVDALTMGIEQTEKLDWMVPATFDDVVTVTEQQAHFNQWMASLAPVRVGRVPPRAGHDKDLPSVDFGPAARFAAAILRNDPDPLEQVLAPRPKRER